MKLMQIIQDTLFRQIPYQHNDITNLRIQIRGFNS